MAMLGDTRKRNEIWDEDRGSCMRLGPFRFMKIREQGTGKCIKKKDGIGNRHMGMKRGKGKA